MAKKKRDHYPVDEVCGEWGTYLVKASLSEEAGAKDGVVWPDMSDGDIEAYRENISPDFETQIYLRPTPIMVNSGEVSDVLTIHRNGKVIRIYPPFKMNEQSETSGAFKDVLVPEGTQDIERRVELPSSAVLGVRMQHGVSETTKWCRGIRIDFQSGADVTSILNLLLDHICQYTHQWWIRASYNPMLGPLRVGGAITKDFRITRELRYRGAGEVEASWYGAVQYQPNLGFGSPLTNGAWLLAAHHTQEGRKADQGLLAFYDGMADYMAGRHDKAILNLCIATEIMLSKHSFAILGCPPSKLDKAIRKTELVEKPIREMLKHLLIDRNQVAHGREVGQVHNEEKRSVEGYVHAVRHLVTAYLHAMPLGDWPEVMDLRLDKSQNFTKQKHT